MSGMRTDDEIRVRFTVTKDEAMEYLDHQQRLTAAREAVVEAARQTQDAQTVGEHMDASEGLRAAVAALRAIEQETSNG